MTVESWPSRLTASHSYRAVSITVHYFQKQDAIATHPQAPSCVMKDATPRMLASQTAMIEAARLVRMSLTDGTVTTCFAVYKALTRFALVAAMIRFSPAANWIEHWVDLV